MEQPLPPQFVLYQLGTAYYVSQALFVAAKLGVADHLQGGPQRAEDLARATGTHAPSLRRVLRLLVTAGVFAEHDDGRFALTPVSAALASGPDSARASTLLFAGPTQWKTWGDLLETVRTGEPAFSRVTGQGSFEYFESHPEEGANFDQAMSAFTAIAGRAVAGAYDFGGVRSVVDLGGGNGALMVALLGAAPHLRGAVFDLPRLEPAARARVAAAQLGERLAFVGGDFFEAVPAGFDAYVLKHVIHDWDDARAVKILENVRRAMRADARVLIVEGVYPPRVDASPASRSAAANDCNMLVATGGRQRSEQEFRELYAAAGLRLNRIVPTPMSSVIEGVAG